jgi:hypothetical protein
MWRGGACFGRNGRKIWIGFWMVSKTRGTDASVWGDRREWAQLGDGGCWQAQSGGHAGFCGSGGNNGFAHLGLKVIWIW